MLWLDASTWPDGPFDASALAFVRHCSVFKEPVSGRDGPREGIRQNPGRYSSPGWAWGVRTARYQVPAHAPASGAGLRSIGMPGRPVNSGPEIFRPLPGRPAMGPRGVFRGPPSLARGPCPITIGGRVLGGRARSIIRADGLGGDGD